MTSEQLPILVGIDGSTEAAVAARWALREARRRNVPLQAVLVWSYIDQPSHDFDPAFSQDDAEDALRTFLTSALDADVAETVDRRLMCDLPARGLLEAAADSALLVVGARGAGGFPGLRLGSVADRVAQRAAVPVVIVCGKGATDGRIVVGHDGSAGSDAALAWAAAEARIRAAHLEVVRSWEPPALIDWTFMPDAPVIAKQRAGVEEELDAAISRFARDVHVSRSFVAGSPARHLVEAAATASMVVVGRRGHGTLAGIALGSVSRQVVHHAPCPVVVVPPPV